METNNKDLTPSPSPLERGKQEEIQRAPHYMTANPDAAKVLVAHARENRKNLTESEKLLWEELRGSKLGQKFRRQHYIGNYIADFACLEKRLVVEIDGDYHNHPKQAALDEERTLTLEQKHLFKVMRFTNEEVIFGMAGVLGKIKEFLKAIEI